MAKLKNIILSDGGKILLDTETKEPSLTIETTSGKSVKLNIKGNIELVGGTVTFNISGMSQDMGQTIASLGQKYENNKKNLENLITEHNQRTDDLRYFLELNENQTTQFAEDFQNIQNKNDEIAGRIEKYQDEALSLGQTITGLLEKQESTAAALLELQDANTNQSQNLQTFLDSALDSNGDITLRLNALSEELSDQVEDTRASILSTEEVMNEIATAMTNNLQESENFSNALNNMISGNENISNSINSLRNELSSQLSENERLLDDSKELLDQTILQVDQNTAESQRFQTEFSELTSENGQIATSINSLRGDLEGEIQATAALIQSTEEIMSEIATSVAENRIESEAFKNAIDGVIAENSSIENNINALRQGLQGQIDSTNALLNTVSGSLDQTAQAVADNKRESDLWQTETLPDLITTTANVAGQISDARNALEKDIKDINDNLEQNYQTALQTSDAISGLQQTILDSEGLNQKITDAKTGILNDINTQLGDTESALSRLVQSNAAELSLTAADIEAALVDSTVIAKQDAVADATAEQIRNLKETDIHDVRGLAINAAISAGAATSQALAASGSAAQAKISANLSYDMSDFAKKSAISSYSAAGTAIKSAGNALLAVELATYQANSSLKYAQSSAQLSGQSAISSGLSATASSQSANAAGISIKAAGDSLLASSTALQAASWSDVRASRAAELAGLSGQSAGVSSLAATQANTSAGISIKAAGDSLLASTTALQAASWSDVRASRAAELAGLSGQSAGVSSLAATQANTSAGISIKAAGDSLLASSTALQAASWSDVRASRAASLALSSADAASLSATSSTQSVRSAGISIKAAGDSLLASSTALQAASWSDVRASRAAELAGLSGQSAAASAVTANQSVEMAGISIKAASDSLLASTTALQAASWSDARANMAGQFATNANQSAGVSIDAAETSLASANLAIKSAGDALLASTTALQASSWSDARANMAGQFATSANSSANTSLESAQNALGSATTALDIANRLNLFFDDRNNPQWEKFSFFQAAANKFSTNFYTNPMAGTDNKFWSCFYDPWKSSWNYGQISDLQLTGARPDSAYGKTKGPTDLSLICANNDAVSGEKNSIRFLSDSGVTYDGRRQISQRSLISHVEDPSTTTKNPPKLVFSVAKENASHFAAHHSSLSNINNYSSSESWKMLEVLDLTVASLNNTQMEIQSNKIDFFTTGHNGTRFSIKEKSSEGAADYIGIYPDAADGVHVEGHLHTTSISNSKIYTNEIFIDPSYPKTPSAQSGKHWTIVVGPWSGNSNTLRFRQDGSTKAVIKRDQSTVYLNFTGQHRAQRKEEKNEFLKGLIVVSSGEYSDNISSTKGDNEIQINEALPKLSISVKRNDKRVFGVVSDEEEKNSSSREYSSGNFVSVFDKIEGDDRLIVNSLGEGAIWVTNINGNLENGDYITTCEIPGYGMKQDDDLLHNYTVAKITCDCDFDLESNVYKCVEFEYNGNTYKKAFVGCTYHCG